MSGRKFKFSFRTKIAALAGLVTGGIVLGACALLWEITYHFNIESLDRDLHNFAQSNLQRQVGRSHWKRVQESITVVSDKGESLRYSISVYNRGRLSFKSPDWPEALVMNENVAALINRRELREAPAAPRKDRPISKYNPPLEILEEELLGETVGGKKWRVGIFDNFYTVLVVAADFDAFDTRMVRLKRSYFAVTPFALLMAVTGAWFVARRSLRPVGLLTTAVEGVTAKGLDQRIEKVGHEVEFQQLVSMFNEMMERLEKAFLQSSRFSADASHELKTPLARLQMELEEAIRGAPAESKQQEVYSNLLDEISRMSLIVSKLTLLSSSDAGKLRLTLEKTNLSQMLANVSEDCEAVGQDREVEISIEENVTVLADGPLLEQALQNLASNALKYGASESSIRFELRKSGQVARVSVSNEGMPVPPGDWERIFERFHRVDISRSGRDRGVGLGLSLSREIVRAHAGDLWLENSDQTITVFALELPLVDGR